MSSVTHSCSIDYDISNELLVEILLYLPTSSMMSARLVNHRWNALTSTNFYWKHHYKRHIDGPAIDVDVASWFDECVSALKKFNELKRSVEICLSSPRGFDSHYRNEAINKQCMWMIEHGYIQWTRDALHSGEFTLNDTFIMSNYQDRGPQKAMHVATRGNQLRMMQFLQSCGASVHERISSGAAPIHIAAFEGYLEIVKWLMDMGADANDMGFYSRSPMILACEQAQTAVIAFLASRKGDLRLRHYSPAHIVARYGTVDEMKTLLNAKANVNDIAPNTSIRLIHLARDSIIEPDMAAFLASLSENAGE